MVKIEELAIAHANSLDKLEDIKSLILERFSVKAYP